MRRDLLLLGEMIQAADRAHELTHGLSLRALQDDRLRSESLLWNFTVLGEAAAQLSGEVKERFPDIAWQQPARLRNRIVHGYWSIDLEILHTTATDQLPSFAADLRRVLATLATEAEPPPASQIPGTTPVATTSRHPAAPGQPARDGSTGES
jgi:uncharacterized protein with HEPN domain